MPEGKWNAYENDLRIPFLIRGPGIAPGSTFRGLATQVDVMPTLLDLAGGVESQPVLWDGRSAAHLLRGAPLSNASWRTDLIIEYFAGGDVVRYEHLEDAANNSFRLLRRLDPTAPPGRANLSFAQFVGPDNWDFTQPVPLNETELFNLDDDPYQLHNAKRALTPALRKELEVTLDRLYLCAGSGCN